MVNELVDLEEWIPGVCVELRYATSRNLVGRPVYASPRAWLVEPVARRLSAVESELRAEGLGLKIWDAFRSAAAQRALWESCPDPRFVAPPERGSRHSRGVAVDVTLIRRSDQQELAMGTDFDDFGPAAAAAFEDLPEDVRARRLHLRNAMFRHGFEGIQSEWWHFHAEDWASFPLRG